MFIRCMSVLKKSIQIYQNTNFTLPWICFLLQIHIKPRRWAKVLPGTGGFLLCVGPAPRPGQPDQRSGGLVQPVCSCIPDGPCQTAVCSPSAPAHP